MAGLVAHLDLVSPSQYHEKFNQVDLFVDELLWIGQELPEHLLVIQSWQDTIASYSSNIIKLIDRLNF